MFPRAIPLSEASCIRVTHPSAGRHQEQALMLPLDLHVLGLPLAFILSQDQTLHRNIIFNVYAPTPKSQGETQCKLSDARPCLTLCVNT